MKNNNKKEYLITYDKIWNLGVSEVLPLEDVSQDSNREGRININLLEQTISLYNKNAMRWNKLDIVEMNKDGVVAVGKLDSYWGNYIKQNRPDEK